MKCSRRHFLKALFAATISMILRLPIQAASLSGKSRIADNKKYSRKRSVISVVSGRDPSVMTKKSVELLGGMGKFVKKGARVVVKPNMGFDRAPEYAATTNPLVISTIVKLCFEAGAREVRIFDRPASAPPELTYHSSGIKEAAEKVGAKVVYMSQNDYVPVQIPSGGHLKKWDFYRHAVQADVFINVPIAKHHSSATLTMGMKNLMGIVGGNRGTMHFSLHQSITDINSVFKIDLTILDAFRILTKHGPSGGSVEDVYESGQIIAGSDRVAVDSYASTLFGLSPHDIKHIVLANKAGLGEMDLEKMEIIKADCN